MIKKEIINFYLPIIKKYKSLFFLMWFSWLISWLASVWIPILLKIETDQLVSKNSLNIFWTNLDWFKVFVLILWVILLVEIIERFLSSIASIFTNSKKDLMKNEIQFNLFSKMENMEIGRSMNSRYKYISNIVEDNFPSISERIISLPHSSIEFIIQLVWITAIYAYFNFTLLLIVVISALIWYWIDIIARKLSQKYEIDWKFTLWRQIYKYSNLFLYNFSNLAISWWLKSTLNDYSYFMSEENKNSIKRDFSSMIWNINNLINYNLRDILLKLIVWYWVFVWTNSVGMVVLVVSSMWTLWWIISTIFNFKNDYKDFLLQQESVLLMLKICVSVWNEKYGEKIKNLEFKNITFSYPNLAKYEKEYIEIVQKNIMWKKLWNSRLDERIKWLIETAEEDSKIAFPQIFNDISFRFQTWKVYWIVWKNWAWKTTLMYLLSWFYRWYDWEILFNSKNTKNFTTESFLEKISFLTQTPFLLEWNSTIKEELFLWAWKDASEAKVWEYLELFWLAKKIKKHKKLLNAEIWNDIEFSGWEKQILVFIRLLLQDRDIVIMDEWTNQLDAENEILVMNELLKHKDKKIIIFITHRMSTISKADEIYCLENWNFSHYWNHSSLLKEWNNAYARFYKSQILHE